MVLGGVSVKYFPGATGKSEVIELEVKESDTVDDVKKMIHKQKGIPIAKKALRFEGEQLQDDRTLSSYYDIKAKSTLYLEGQ